MNTLQGILSCVGNTPLVELDKYCPEAHFSFYAKLEMLNPGGSLKDRPALRMLLEAHKEGDINKDSVIIESSSGNTGIGLAQACAYLGLKFICVTDIRSTVNARQIIKAYGGIIDLIEKPDEEGGYLGARLKRIKQLLQTIPNSFNCNQYTNRNNPLAHYQTIREILESLNNEPDYVFVATSSCGVLRGCAEFVQNRGLDTKIIAVDAKGSVIFGDKPKKRLIPGHGAAVKPPHYREGLEDDFVLVSDLDCVRGCRRLIRREGIFVGGSSGAVMTAIEKYMPKIPHGSVVVAVLCDRGDRYLDTVYSDDWVEKHFGAEVNLLEDKASIQSEDLHFLNN